MFDVLFEQVPDGNERYISWLFEGLGWTVGLALAGWVFAFLLGVLVGCGRTSTNRGVAWASRMYVEVFRNTPIIVQMFLWYFVLPELLPERLGSAMKSWAPPWGAFFPALVALSLYTGARVAEQVKAGLDALPYGQRAAARAMGMTEVQAYLFILLPQALRIILPTLTSEVMGIFKNTSVALTIGLLELTAQARQINEFTFATFPAFGAATLFYLALALCVFLIMHSLERRFTIPGTEPTTNKRRVVSRTGAADAAL